MDKHHQRSDEQSLRLTQAAIANLRAQPGLMREVLATLDHWDLVAPSDSQSLRDAWRQLLMEQAWTRALDTGPLGQQLRQASPLGKALDPAQRLRIIRECRERNSNT